MERTPIEGSKKVKAWGYEPSTRSLEIEYQWGIIIRYKEVPAELIEAFKLADSKGSFLHKHIEYKFGFERVQRRDDIEDPPDIHRRQERSRQPPPEEAKDPRQNRGRRIRNL